MKRDSKEQWNLAWLETDSVKLIWRVLSSKGAKVYFVGGCVRNSVQGKEINDIDIATDALPDEVIKVASDAGLGVITTGYSHGSVSIKIMQELFEVTTFRSDLITDGRHSKVGFSKNILEDAKRRDFTMNALYMTIDGHIFDPILGLEDVINERVQFIGDPDKRVREDFLRVLRYFRFLSIYKKNIDSIDQTLVTVFANAVPGLKMLSHDRVWSELQKILGAENPYVVLKIMQVCGILKEVLPSAKIDCLQRFLQNEDELKLEFQEINRLAALNLSNFRSWTKNFPLTKDQNRWIDKLLVNLKDSSSLRVKGYKYGENLAIVALALLKSDSGATIIREDLAEIKYGSLKRFPIKSLDLLKFFIPSKELGDELKRLKDIWFASDLELSREDLLDELKNNSEMKYI